MKKPALLALTLLAASLRGAAAVEPSSLSYYSLGPEDGLANNSVYCVLQDAAGLMWFGTFGGLSRYDGESFSTYRPSQGGPSLTSSVVFALLEDRAGYLWIGTDGGGLARLDPSRAAIEVFRAGPAAARALSSDRVLCLAMDEEGGIWAGCGDGILNRWDPEARAFSRFDPGLGAPIRCAVQDPRGSILAGTAGGGLLSLDPATGRFTRSSPDPSDSASIGDATVRSILRDSAGRIWLGLGDGGVDLLSPGGFRHARAAGGAGLPAQAVRALVENEDGTIWAGFEDAGIGVLDPSSLSLSPPIEEGGAMLRALYRDKRGLVWAGLKEGGVRAYNPRSALFVRYKKFTDGRPLRRVRGLAQEADGSVLVGTDGDGLARVDPATGRVEAVRGLPKGSSERKVYAILAASDGSIWIGTDGGGLMALRPDGGLRSFRRDPRDASSIAGDVVWSLLEDDDGKIWVGTEGGGLDLLDPATGRFSHHAPSAGDPRALRGASVRAVYEDYRGRLWVGTWDGGLSVMEGRSGEFRSFGPATEDPAALGDASVNCIFEDSSGTLWVGTGGSGLAMLDPVSERFIHFGEAEGLAGATVYGILEDGQGYLWISTAVGLSRFDKATSSFYNFGPEDGLASGDLSQNAFLASRGGELWFGGSGGLTHFDPAALPPPPPPPEIAIIGVESAGEERDFELGADGASVFLGYRNSGLSFHIVVLDYVAPRRNRYAMKLEGRQSLWTSLGTSNAGYIAPLAPGKYALRVKGANGSGIWNEEGAVLSISVTPPIWATWYARLAIGLAVAATAAATVFFRLRNLKRRNALLVKFSRHVEAAREEERAIAAREVHDEIGQSLTVLNLQTYWLSSHPEAGPDQRRSRIQEMQGVIGHAMAAVKALSTRLRPVALDALAFDETLRWYMDSFERRSGIRAEFAPVDPPPRIEGELATMLFRVLQEALTNVIRHSGAKRVLVRLYAAGGEVRMEVEDDGVGIAPGRAEAEDSFGIIGMRERCAMAGGSLEIGRRPEGGTSLRVRVPQARGA